MAPIYAGILGFLAFATTVVRGLVHGGDVGSTLFAAWCGLFAFAAIGYVVGGLAGWMVTQSVTARVSSELAAREGTETAGA